VGSVDALPMDEAMGHPDQPNRGSQIRDSQHSLRYELIVVLVAAAIFFGCVPSPPSLMDDVDAVQAQIARNMLDSGDWVTARLNGVAYLEKSPLKYWMMAVSYIVFGVHDWAARIPMALFTVLLCWLVTRIGSWAFGGKTGLYAGLVLSTCVGLFLFTRILIPDVLLTFTITLAMWSFLRCLPNRTATVRESVALPNRAATVRESVAGSCNRTATVRESVTEACNRAATVRESVAAACNRTATVRES